MKRYFDYFLISFKIEVRNLLVFRSNFFMDLLGIAMRVGLLIAFWTAIYIGKTQMDGIDYYTMIFYAVSSIALDILVMQNIETAVTDKIRTGDISMAMTRPISYPVSLVFEQLGQTAQKVVTKLIPCLVIFLFSGIALKADVNLSIYFFLSVALSYLLVLFYQMFFGFIAFWTMEIDGILQARDAAMLVFSGSMIPLWFFPKWLFSIADFLPFQAIYHTPLSILIGKMSGQEIYKAILIQLIWVIVFIAITMYFWTCARRRVVVNGG